MVVDDTGASNSDKITSDATIAGYATDALWHDGVLLLLLPPVGPDQLQAEHAADRGEDREVPRHKAGDRCKRRGACKHRILSARRCRLRIVSGAHAGFEHRSRVNLLAQQHGLHYWADAHPSHGTFQQFGHRLPWTADLDQVQRRLDDITCAHGLGGSPA